MQGRDSNVEQDVSLSPFLTDEHDMAISGDLQSPKFFTTSDDLDEENTQLEDLQQLLEKSFRNEENTKQALVETLTKLESSEATCKELQLELEKTKSQKALAIEALTYQRDAAVLGQNEEKLLNNKLQQSLEEAQLTFEKSRIAYENEIFFQKNEILKLKKIVLKQAKSLEENEKTNASNPYGKFLQEHDRDINIFLPTPPNHIRRR